MAEASELAGVNLLSPPSMASWSVGVGAGKSTGRFPSIFLYFLADQTECETGLWVLRNRSQKFRRETLQATRSCRMKRETGEEMVWCVVGANKGSTWRRFYTCQFHLAGSHVITSIISLANLNKIFFSLPPTQLPPSEQRVQCRFVKHTLWMGACENWDFGPFREGLVAGVSRNELSETALDGWHVMLWESREMIFYDHGDPDWINIRDLSTSSLLISNISCVGRWEDIQSQIPMAIQGFTDKGNIWILIFSTLIMFESEWDFNNNNNKLFW